MDIIQERFDKGLCPICTKQLTEDFKQVKYKGRHIWICKHHKTPEEVNNG